MQNKDARQILEKIRNGTATGEEKAIVESVYAKWMVKNQPELSDVELSNSLSDISRRLPIQRKRKFTPYALGAAASLVLLLFAALYFSSTRQVKDSLVKNDVVQDILPGSNKAILTLSNGIEVPLNDKKGQQDYTAKNPEAVKNDHGIAYNTITTPRGGQYQVLLPDGTHVWLNAASSIRFPLTFTKNERHVAITGEAYFEVTKNKHQPFVVTTGRQSIQVLGTHFNVMAYQDEPSINTTLLEGSIQVDEAGRTSHIGKTADRSSGGCC
jgi:transmembrane sensor